jgi:prolyl-tRNA editing enzyme YbaK/EbsC (Cys-tRNA(Pro) deacylase)
LKTLAVRTGPGYALVVIPASRRLDLHLVRDALGDHHARLASEEELGRDFAGYQLGALPPLGALLGRELYVDPEVLQHDTVAFAAGSQTESSGCEPRSCSAASRSRPCRWLGRRTGAATTWSVGAGGAAERGRRGHP